MPVHVTSLCPWSNFLCLPRGTKARATVCPLLVTSLLPQTEGLLSWGSAGPAGREFPPACVPCGCCHIVLARYSDSSIIAPDTTEKASADLKVLPIP